MEHSVHSLIDRLSPERRQEDRRSRIDEVVLMQREVFGAPEREIFRRLDRRIALRRQADIRRRCPNE